jgi:hypothetical protein
MKRLIVVLVLMVLSVPSAAQAAPGVVPGTGAQLFYDDLAQVNLESKWQISDPWVCSHCSWDPGRDPTQDPYIVKRTTDGSPYVPVGATAPNSVYREFRAPADVQSVYDVAKQPNATRTSLIKGYRYQPGMTTITYLDFRRRSVGFPYDVASGWGITRYSQLLQLKDWQADPIPFLALGRDGFKLSVGSQVQQLVPAPENQWMRIAIEMRTGAGSYIRLWGDLNADGVLSPLGGRNNIHNASIPAREMYFCLGLYHVRQNFTEDISVDIANPTVATFSQ